MALAISLATLKTALGVTGATRDDELTVLAGAIDRHFENFMARPLEAKERTELYNVRPGMCAVSLRARPVSTVAEIRLDSDRLFPSSTILAASSYHASRAGKGRVYFTSSVALPVGRETMQIKYTGGMGTDEADLQANFPNIALAARMQALEMDRRASNPGATSTTHHDTATTSYVGELQLLKAVRELLQPYKYQRV